MQSLADGSLLVAVSQTSSSSYFSAPANLLRLSDANNDGVGDGPGQVLYANLPGVVTSVRAAGSLIFATSVRSGQERINVLRQGTAIDDPYALLGSINFSFPSDWEHKSYALAVRPGESPGGYELFFNVGSRLNNANDATQVVVSGLIAGSVLGESIYRLSLTDDGVQVSWGSLERVASGLRNAAGIGFEPATGDLVFEDNGIDTPGHAVEPQSADEINRVVRDDIGGTIEDFGFAANYVEYRTGITVGGGGMAPTAAFQPLGDPLSGSESEGAVEIAFAPPEFPLALRHGMFVGFHGQSQLAGLANEENPVAWVDPATGEYFHFISNDEPVIGHPDWLLTTDDSLFIGDLSSTGLTSGSGAGVIYQVQYLPPLRGDANDDCVVGAADYTVWAAQFGQAGNALAADFDASGGVGSGDYVLWASNFGASCPPPGALVPEPSGIDLCLAALAWFAVSFARQCRRRPA